MSLAISSMLMTSISRLMMSFFRISSRSGVSVRGTGTRTRLSIFSSCALVCARFSSSSTSILRSFGEEPISIMVLSPETAPMAETHTRDEARSIPPKIFAWLPIMRTVPITLICELTI